MVVRLPWLQKLHFAAIVLDEAQAIKNATSQRGQAVRELHSSNRIALSGTPVENHLGELHSLMDFLNPGLLGSRSSFDAFTKGLGSDYTPLRKLVRPFILRRLKSDRSLIPDLPDKTEINAYCQLTPLQASLYQAEINALHAVLDEEDPETRLMLLLPILAHLKQICNHPDQFLGTGDYATESSGKFMRLKELAETIMQRHEKVLLFTQFRSVMDPVSDLLAKVFGRPGLQLHGSTPMPQRQELVRQFQQDNGPPFMVLSLKAAGTGLTLTQASHVIHFDRWWNPAVENQATDRAYRIGQHKNVLVHKLICRGTIEDSIDRMLQKKQAMADALFGMGSGLESLLLKMSSSEIEELLRGPLP
jgi:non-specific serine/threonine protein kinase